MAGIKTAIALQSNQKIFFVALILIIFRQRMLLVISDKRYLFVYKYMKNVHQIEMQLH